MTASLLQLVSVGSEDFYIIGNPQLSYFKSVFKRHTRTHGTGTSTHRHARQHRRHMDEGSFPGHAREDEANDRSSSLTRRRSRIMSHRI